MRLDQTTPPDKGSVTLVYACDDCGYEMAMLTNAHETQMVGSLGVEIGAAAGSGKSASKCPFTGMVQDMNDDQAQQPDQVQQAETVPWTPGARERLETIPTFLRPMAKTGIEKFAKDNGHAEVDEAVLTEARSHFGM
jgi:hypothetical protein